MNLDVGELRREFVLDELRRKDLNPNPVEQFELWFKQACKAQILDANAMSLATASAQGEPTLRTVLLKYFDDKGFVFYTNLESVKAEQIAENPHAALMFFWPLLERQVVIRGIAEKMSVKESVRYFLSRPRDSQIGAWVSQQSHAISSRKLLEMKYLEFKRKWREGEVPVPSFWGGYRVVPRHVEFWQGRPNRLHDRFLYSRGAEDVWSIERLAP